MVVYARQVLVNRHATVLHPLQYLTMCIACMESIIDTFSNDYHEAIGFDLCRLLFCLLCKHLPSSPHCKYPICG